MWLNQCETSVDDIQVFEVCDDVDEKAFSDHQQVKGVKGVDSLRLQIRAIRDRSWCYNKFEM